MRDIVSSSAVPDKNILIKGAPPCRTRHGNTSNLLHDDQYLVVQKTTSFHINWTELRINEEKAENLDWLQKLASKFELICMIRLLSLIFGHKLCLFLKPNFSQLAWSGGPGTGYYIDECQSERKTQDFIKHVKASCKGAAASSNE